MTWPTLPRSSATRRACSHGSTARRFASACRDVATLFWFALAWTFIGCLLITSFCGCSSGINNRIVPSAQRPGLGAMRVVTHVPVPCTTPPPPPAPLEEYEADPHDGATHDRIVCGALDPWECDAVRRAVWSGYGRVAAIYIEMIRAECARGVTP